MNHATFTLFLCSLAILLATAITLGQLADYLKLPKVIGELIAGILLGPTVLGFYFPTIYQQLFAITHPHFQARDAFVKLSAIFLLFVVGLEINLPAIQRLRNTILWTSVCGFLFPFVLGVTTVICFPDLWNLSRQSSVWLLPLFIGTALSVSALPVIARVLLDLGLLKSKVGGLILATATLDDIVGWIAFALIAAHFAPTETHLHPAITLFGISLLFIFVITTGKRWANQWVSWNEQKNTTDSLFLSLILVCVLFTATFVEMLGIHAVLGGFLMGIAFSSDEPQRMHIAMHQLAVSFFAPLYFISVGLQVNFLRQFDLKLVLLVIGIATIGKVVGVFIGARVSQLSVKESLALGFGMNARGQWGLF